MFFHFSLFPFAILNGIFLSFGFLFPKMFRKSTIKLHRKSQKKSQKIIKFFINEKVKKEKLHQENPQKKNLNHEKIQKNNQRNEKDMK